ncbi:MAG: xanthosine triphosphate pyrophosphatase, partial [Acetatifactor sp.]|nr:xanthosine triphosphate pyrophosphatase [Acetatifactor sp.]
MNLLFATSNPAKYTAMRDALQPLGIRLLCLRDMEHVPVAPEDGSTPLENSSQKALFYYDHYGIPLFSCDSGLYLENLPQELQPGLNVRSPQGVYLDDQAMLEYYGGLAARYGDITARYRNAVCLILDREHICESMDESLASRRFLLTAKPHEIRRPGFP